MKKKANSKTPKDLPKVEDATTSTPDIQEPIRTAIASNTLSDALPGPSVGQEKNKSQYKRWKNGFQVTSHSVSMATPESQVRNSWQWKNFVHKDLSAETVPKCPANSEDSFYTKLNYNKSNTSCKSNENLNDGIRLQKSAKIPLYDQLLLMMFQKTYAGSKTNNGLPMMDLNHKAMIMDSDLFCECESSITKITKQKSDDMTLAVKRISISNTISNSSFSSLRKTNNMHYFSQFLRFWNGHPGIRCKKSESGTQTPSSSNVCIFNKKPFQKSTPVCYEKPKGTYYHGSPPVMEDKPPKSIERPQVQNMLVTMQIQNHSPVQSQSRFAESVLTHLVQIQRKRNWLIRCFHKHFGTKSTTDNDKQIVHDHSFPATIEKVKKMAVTSILIKWRVHDSKNITGFEVFIDGLQVLNVLKSYRRELVISDFNYQQPHKIVLRALPMNDMEIAINPEACSIQPDGTIWYPSIYLYSPKVL